MEDKKVKKRLARVPDLDKDGEPIWKITGSSAKPKPSKPRREGKKEKS